MLGCTSLTLLGTGTALGAVGTYRAMGYFTGPEVIPTVLQDTSLMGRVSQLATGLNDTAETLYLGGKGLYSDVVKVRGLLDSVPYIGEYMGAAFSLFMVYQAINLASNVSTVTSAVMKVAKSAKEATQSVFTFFLGSKGKKSEPQITVKAICDSDGNCIKLDGTHQFISETLPQVSPPAA